MSSQSESFYSIEESYLKYSIIVGALAGLPLLTLLFSIVFTSNYDNDSDKTKTIDGLSEAAKNTQKRSALVDLLFFIR